MQMLAPPKILGRPRKSLKFFTKIMKINLSIDSINEMLLSDNNCDYAENNYRVSKEEGSLSCCISESNDE